MALGGCGKPAASAQTFTEAEVRAFLDESFDALLKRDPVRLCATFSRDGVYKSRYQPYAAGSKAIYTSIDGAGVCERVKVFVTLPEQKLEYRDENIEMAADGRSARVHGEYVEIVPNYDAEDPPQSLDDYDDLAVIESHTESTVAMMAGKLVVVSGKSRARATKLMPRGTARSTGR